MSKKKIRVGIAGVGNNASALVQGVYRYSQPGFVEAEEQRKHSVVFPRLCGYDIRDIEFTSAFDVDARKIGRDLGTAIFQAPNNYPSILDRVPVIGVEVHPAPILDGVPEFLEERVQVARELKLSPRAEEHFERCVEEVRRTETRVLLNFLPSGSDQATQFFARVAAAGGAAYINSTPTPAAHSPEILELFEDAGLPILGDDLESQFGSSLIHRTLLRALEERGISITHSYQVNLGGNSDFMNLSHRPGAKKKSKMKAISTASSTGSVDILPSGGFLKGLNDRKVGYIVIEGQGWLGTPVNIDLKLQVQDSSNAAGVTIDLIRIAQGAIDRGLAGDVPMSYYFKNPLTDKLDTEAAIAAVRRFDEDGRREVTDLAETA